MDAIKYSLIDFIKTSNFTKPLYNNLKSRANVKKFSINNIPEIKPYIIEDNSIRYNLVLPTLRKTKVFGGILTAIKIFQTFLEKKGIKGRVIVLSNESRNEKWTYMIKNSNNQNLELFFISEGNRINVGINDIFILTSWKTAYVFIPILLWQIKQYNLKNRKALYLIQDYEPGFSAWSTEYVLAESTYKYNSNLIMAIFNSKELYNFFEKKGYQFSCKFYFEPVLNEQLKKHLINLEKKPHQREKTILIYGRPSEPRNAFEIIRHSLSIWSQNYKHSKEWTIISLGEGFKDIELPNNTIKAKGKVTLKEYATIMHSVYAGISLMVSPHPSYPPLEMSTFGIKTITNMFENKDLSYFNDNIISVPICAPVEIANRLMEVCDLYGKEEAKVKTGTSYFNGNTFNKVMEEVGERLYGMAYEK